MTGNGNLLENKNGTNDEFNLMYRFGRKWVKIILIRSNSLLKKINCNLFIFWFEWVDLFDDCNPFALIYSNIKKNLQNWSKMLTNNGYNYWHSFKCVKSGATNSFILTQSEFFYLVHSFSFKWIGVLSWMGQIELSCGPSQLIYVPKHPFTLSYWTPPPRRPNEVKVPTRCSILFTPTNVIENEFLVGPH